MINVCAHLNPFLVFEVSCFLEVQNVKLWFQWLSQKITNEYNFSKQNHCKILNELIPQLFSPSIPRFESQKFQLLLEQSISCFWKCFPEAEKHLSITKAQYRSISAWHRTRSNPAKWIRHKDHPTQSNQSLVPLLNLSSLILHEA